MNSKILVVMALSAALVAGLLASSGVLKLRAPLPADPTALTEKTVTKIKYNGCSGQHEIARIDNIYWSGQIKKDGVITVRVVGEYIKKSYIIMEKVEVKVGFLKIYEETVDHRYHAEVGKPLDKTESTPLPLDPIDGDYKLITHSFDEFGIEQGCWIFTFTIGTVPSPTSVAK